MKIVEIMAQLRAKGGCEWDRAQNHRSLLPYLLEESYEFIDSVKSEDDAAMCEELGDLLLQVAFHAQIADEAGRFDFDDVDQAISEKMRRRHPHVFAKGASSLDHQHWESLKHAEREAKGLKSLMDDIPKSLPAISRAEKIQNRAAKAGFDWAEPEPVIDKIREELAEVEAAMQGDGDVEEELGDLLFACVNLARHLGVKSEMALDDCNRKFMARFAAMEDAVAPQALSGRSLEALERLWLEAKLRQKARPSAPRD